MPSQYFNAVTFTGDVNVGNRGFVKHRKINNRRKYVTFISKTYPQWRWITFYRRSDNAKSLLRRSEWV